MNIILRDVSHKKNNLTNHNCFEKDASESITYAYMFYILYVEMAGGSDHVVSPGWTLACWPGFATRGRRLLFCADQLHKEPVLISERWRAPVQSPTTFFYGPELHRPPL